MYPVKTPRFIRSLFPNFTWNVPTKDKVLYLTFDDGPIPEVTPWVLEQLKKYDAKATFFCVGENAQKNPEILEMVRAQGHSIGSHTMNHLNAWKSDNLPFFHNVRRAATLLRTELFRPPYGRLLPSQIQFLQRHYTIVMWDILTGDFDPKISGEQCYRNVMKNVSNGSIIVFHDSLKARPNLEYALPRALEALSEQGYTFKTLSPSMASVPHGILNHAF